MRRYEATGADGETLRVYEKGPVGLLALCPDPVCGHSRRMIVSMPIHMSDRGADAKLGEIRKHLRCLKCGGRTVQLSPHADGRFRDGR
jgi:hypothetical protein